MNEVTKVVPIKNRLNLFGSNLRPMKKIGLKYYSESEKDSDSEAEIGESQIGKYGLVGFGIFWIIVFKSDFKDAIFAVFDEVNSLVIYYLLPFLFLLIL